MRKVIEKLLESRSSYRIAKDLKINARTVNRYQNGTSEIDKMGFGTAEKLYNYYLKEMEIMGNIKEVIAKIENGEIELKHSEPNYHEEEYIGGSPSNYIVHAIEGQEGLEVFFAEHEEIEELRQEIYDGTKDQSELEKLVINEYADQFNYDDVAAYRIDPGKIEWI